MKVKNTVSFNDIPEIEKLLDNMEVTFKLITGPVGRLVNFWLYHDDKRWKDLTPLLRKHSIEINQSTEFSKKEINDADWFYIESRTIGYPQPDEGNFGYLNITYDQSSVCKQCGTGLIQKSPFQIKSYPKQKVDGFSLDWINDELFVTGVVKSALEEMNVRGINFSNVLKAKDQSVIDGIYQISILGKLQKGLIDYNLNNELCTSCNTTKYNYPSVGGITFRKETFDSKADIIKSSEWFGSGASAEHLILCSKRVFNLFKEKKFKGVKFHPIVNEKIDLQSYQ